MKKLFAIFMTLALLTGALAGCGGTTPEQTPSVSQTPQSASSAETEEPQTPQPASPSETKEPQTSLQE